MVQSTEEKEKPPKVIERLPKEQREARVATQPGKTEELEEDDRMTSERHEQPKQESSAPQSEESPAAFRKEVFQDQTILQSEQGAIEREDSGEVMRRKENESSAPLPEKEPEETKMEETVVVKAAPTSYTRPPERGKRRTVGEGVKQIRNLSQSKEPPTASKEAQSKGDFRVGANQENQVKPASPWKIPEPPVKQGGNPAKPVEGKSVADVVKEKAEFEEAIVAEEKPQKEESSKEEGESSKAETVGKEAPTGERTRERITRYPRPKQDSDRRRGDTKRRGTERPTRGRIEGGPTYRRERGGRYGAGGTRPPRGSTRGMSLRGRGRGRGTRPLISSHYNSRHEDDWDTSSDDDSESQSKKESQKDAKGDHTKFEERESTTAEEKGATSEVTKSEDPRGRQHHGNQYDGRHTSSRDHHERREFSRRPDTRPRRGSSRGEYRNRYREEMMYDDSSKELRPRGEPSRRGRGTFTGMRGRGRGSRGGGGGRGSRDGYYSNRDDNRGSRRDEGAMMRPTVWNNSEADESSEKSERGTPQENDGNKETKLNEMEGEETSDFRRTRNSYSDGMDRSRRGTRGGRHPGQRQPPKPRPQRPEKPPRFQKVNGRGRGRGNPRHGDGRMDSLGRGRSRDGGAPGSSLSSGERTPPRVGRPTLVKQSSSEHNNEEWETASESSDFNDRRGGDETKENNGDYSDPERQPGDTEGATSNGPKPYDKGKDEQGRWPSVTLVAVCCKLVRELMNCMLSMYGLFRCCEG